MTDFFVSRIQKLDRKFFSRLQKAQNGCFNALAKALEMKQNDYKHRHRITHGRRKGPSVMSTNDETRSPGLFGHYYLILKNKLTGSFLFVSIRRIISSMPISPLELDADHNILFTYRFFYWLTDESSVFDHR